MTYYAKINGSETPVGLTASDDNAAVDAARKAVEALTPKEGGDFSVEVYELQGSTQRHVSGFGVRHEPHESVREAVEAKRAEEAAAKARAETRSQIEAEYLAKLRAEGKLKEVAP